MYTSYIAFEMPPVLYRGFSQIHNGTTPSLSSGRGGSPVKIENPTGTGFARMDITYFIDISNYILHVHLISHTTYAFGITFSIFKLKFCCTTYRVAKIHRIRYDTGHFPPIWPTAEGSLGENDLNYNEPYESSPPCIPYTWYTKYSIYI